MIDWTYVAVPFLVLPIVMLFRFVGCPAFTGSDAPSPPGTPVPGEPPNYSDYLLGVTSGTVKDGVPATPADIIAYWRLVNQPVSGVAADEVHGHDGTFVEVTGGIFYAGKPSLITATEDDRKDTCSDFEGGYVIVPYKDGLYENMAQGNFTIECWLHPQWNQSPKAALHTLFYAGGHYQSPTQFAAQQNGLHIYADENNGWQVDILPNPSPHDGSQVPPKPPMAPNVIFNIPTHLVVVLRKNASALTDIELWMNGYQAFAVKDALVALAVPLGAPLLIGVANGSTVDPQLAAATVTPINPFQGEIQEVVLYRRALTAKEILTHYRLNSPTGGY